MKLLIILYLCFYSVEAFPKEAIEGFLSGFQNTNVYLKSDCFSLQWQKSFKDSFNILLHSDQLSKFQAFLSLYSAIKSLQSSCHLYEIFEIASYVVSLSPEDLILHTLLHSPQIFIELTNAELDNTFKLYESLGKICRIWVNESNDIGDAALGDFFFGFLERIGEENERCREKARELQKLNEIGSLGYAELKNFMKELNVLEIDQACELSKWVLDKDEGDWVIEYIKFGMHLKENEEIAAKISLKVRNNDYYTAGVLLYQLLESMLS